MIKRGFDLLAVLAALPVVLPLALVIALLVRASLGPPVLFRQERIGWRGRAFQIIKFRTMRAAYGPEGQLLPDEARLTRFGAFLRTTSLDELPELWNVLLGEMSLVGPRPLLADYLPFYSAEQARRHEVRPGITGWAQINGRNSVSWEEKFRLDVWYVDHQTSWLDLKILFLTALKVFRREGIAAAGHVTMPRFDDLPRQTTSRDG